MMTIGGLYNGGWPLNLSRLFIFNECCLGGLARSS